MALSGIVANSLIPLLAQKTWFHNDPCLHKLKLEEHLERVYQNTGKHKQLVNPHMRFYLLSKQVEFFGTAHQLFAKTNSFYHHILCFF